MNENLENMTEEQLQEQAKVANEYAKAANEQAQAINAEMERRKRGRFLEDCQYLKERWGEEVGQFLVNAYEELQCEQNHLQDEVQKLQRVERRKTEVESFEKASQGTKKQFKSAGGYANRTPRSLGFMDKQQVKTEPEVIQGFPAFDGREMLNDLFGPPDEPVPNDELAVTQEVSSDFEAINKQVKAEAEADYQEVPWRTGITNVE